MRKDIKLVKKEEKLLLKGACEVISEEGTDIKVAPYCTGLKASETCY